MADSAPADFWAKVEAVNAILLEQEPENISVDSYGGYTGYKPQYIKNAMNRVFGLDGWGYDEISSEVLMDKTGGPTLVVGEVEVYIVGLNRRPKAYGQNRVTKGDVGDARKGMKTDGMKKALSDFSIGTRAFEGKLDEEDANEWKRKQEEAAKQKQMQARARTNTTQPRQERTERKPDTAQQNSATATPTQDMARKCFTRAKTLGISSKEAWDKFILDVLKTQKPADQWDLNDVSRINGELTRREREKQPA